MGPSGPCGVCGVLDAAELCRSCDSREEWRDAAAAAFSHVAETMEALNVDAGLYAAVAACDAAAASLPASASTLARALRSEFERDGAHLDAASRRRVQGLKVETHALEYEALRPWEVDADAWRFDCDDAVGTAAAIQGAYGDDYGRAVDATTLELVGHGAIVDVALRTCRDRRAREAVFEKHVAKFRAAGGGDASQGDHHHARALGPGPLTAGPLDHETTDHGLKKR